MDSNQVIALVKALVRPYLEVLLGTTLVILAVWLTFKYGDAELARTIVLVIVTAGVSLFSYYFGERGSKAKAEK